MRDLREWTGALYIQGTDGEYQKEREDAVRANRGWATVKKALGQVTRENNLSLVSLGRYAWDSLTSRAEEKGSAGMVCGRAASFDRVFLSYASTENVLGFSADEAVGRKVAGALMRAGIQYRWSGEGWHSIEVLLPKYPWEGNTKD